MKLRAGRTALRNRPRPASGRVRTVVLPEEEVAAVPSKPRTETSAVAGEDKASTVVSEARKEQRAAAAAEAGKDRQAEIRASREREVAVAAEISDRNAGPAAGTGETQDAVAARVNRQQAAAAAATAAAAQKQDAVAAKVNRRQAAAAAEVRARQATTETGERGKGIHPPEAVRRATGPVAQVLTFPYFLGRAVAEDVLSTARRPDALLYWGGLAGLAALGVLEWPAAAAVGVGVAVASGVRRSRT
jgi:hypothetical protein